MRINYWYQREELICKKKQYWAGKEFGMPEDASQAWRDMAW
jgi:hypothetical protein